MRVKVWANPRRHRRALITATLSSAAVALAVVACNAILDNEDGVFVSGEGGLSDAPNLPDAFSPILGCEKTPSEDPSVLQDKCGIFVFQGAGVDTHPGSMREPVATIKRGVELAVAHRSYRVYVCNAVYTESVSIVGRADPNQNRPDEKGISEGVSIIGGLTCAQFQWAHAPNTRAVLMDNNNSFPLIIRQPTRAMIVEDLEIKGNPSAQGAVFVYSPPDAGVVPALVRFSRCLITGAQGNNGSPDFRPPDVFPDAASFVGLDAIGNNGGATNNCGCNGETSTGGRGGNTNQMGSPGQPGNTPGGNAGCNPGNAGTPGLPGANGTAATTLGRFDTNGWSPAMGTAAERGHIGSGGGGGGGNGAGGGGGGGCGTCGGESGGVGRGGGASFAIGAVWSNVAIAGGELVALDAGNGSVGANGQDGMLGADGGAGMGGCGGGKGGNGGQGGVGGSGAGGVSAGVLWVGTQPTIDPSTKVTVGFAGRGGTGAVQGVAGPLVEAK